MQGMTEERRPPVAAGPMVPLTRFRRVGQSKVEGALLRETAQSAKAIELLVAGRLAGS